MNDITRLKIEIIEISLHIYLRLFGDLKNLVVFSIVYSIVRNPPYFDLNEKEAKLLIDIKNLIGKPICSLVGYYYYDYRLCYRLLDYIVKTIIKDEIVV